MLFGEFIAGIGSRRQRDAGLCVRGVDALNGPMHQHWPDACGPSEDGGIWHYDLQGVQEISTPLVLTFDDSAGQLRAAPGNPAPPRTTITLTISGNADFCGALRDAFVIE